MIDAQKTAGRNNKAGSQKTNRLLVEQTRLLELIASGKPLKECLSALCSAISRLNPGVRASVLLADEHRKAFKRPIAPELLPSFGEGLEGAPINNLCIGTCGEAVFSGEQIICEDIENDSTWSKEWRELCVANGILGCQSTPVFDNGGNARASFMLCFNETRTSNEWEQRLAEFGTHIISIALERERSNKALLKREEELRKSREQLTIEIDSLQRLQEISTKLIKEDDVDALYKQILNAAVAIMQSDYGTIQLFYPDHGSGGELRILDHRGFSQQDAEFFEWIDSDTKTSCGKALHTRKRCVIPNIEESDFMEGSEEQKIHLQAGIYAFQSTPLFSRSGQLLGMISTHWNDAKTTFKHRTKGRLGMISTHWNDPHEPSENELRSLDVLARQAADMIERSQAEKELRESEEQFRAFVTVSSDAIYRMSADWTKMYHLDGQSFIADMDETSSNWLDEYIHPDDQQRVQKAINEAIRTKSVFDLEHRVLQVDGTMGWTHSRAIPILNDEDEIIEWFGTAKDVTERKKTEKALHASENKYRTLFDSMDEGYCVIEMIFDEDDKPVDYRFIEVNNAFEQQSGMHDVTDKRMLEFVPEIEEHWLENYGKVVRTGKSIRFANEYKSLDRWFDVYAFRPEGWNENRIAVLFSDITKENQAKQALRQNSERLKTVLEGSEVGAWDLNLEDNAAWRSVEHDRILGYDEMLPDWTYDIFIEHVLPEDREMVGQKFKKALEENGIWDFECRITRRDGEKRWIWARGQVFHGDDNSPRRMLGTVQDITGRKQSEVKAAFRATLTDALRPLLDPADIKAEATRILGEHLGVSRALYADAEEDEMYISVKQNYVDGVSPVTGRFRLNDFGRELMNDIRAGITLTVSDVNDFDEEPRLQEAERGAYDAMGVQAYAAVPLIKDGKLVAYLGFHQSEPRDWTHDEIALMEETAERTWGAVERARAEQEVQRSEYQYRTLFESIDEGYCIIEVAFDENKKPVNYKVIEANPAAKSLIGAMKVEGKSAREILPEEQVFSFETYGNVVLTREPVHFERYAQSLDRYFSVSVYPYGQPEERKAAVLFNDITENKRSEQTIRHSSERLKAVLKGSEVGAWDFNVEESISWNSPEYDRIFGYDEPTTEWTYEKFMEHVLPEDRERVDREYSETLNGNAKQLDLEFQIRRADGEKRWIWSHGQVIREEETDSPKRVVGTIQDITGRKREEMNSHFLASLSKELQSIKDPDEIMATTVEMLGEHLEVHRCAYAEVEGDEDSFIITGDYTRGDMISIVGNWQMSAFGSEALHLMRENEVYIVDDVDKDERITQADREAYEQTKIEAVICVPLHKAGKFVAGMAVHQNKPRHWLTEEVDLTVQVVNRCWEAIERARINRDLQEMNETLEERVEERTSALLSYQKQLRSLATRLNKTEEEERRRLATELHDNLGQMLAVTKMKLDLMEKTGNISDIGEASDLVDDALVYTRELMSDLKPPPSLGEEGISENLNWLAKKMSKHGLNVTFRNGNTDKPLKSDVQTTLIQSVRELLFNVVKHANTNDAQITLSYPDHSIEIAVEDEGGGFNTESNKPDLSKGSGFGLFNICERIDLLGGRVEIDSAPGEGTKVNLLVPLDARKSNDLPSSNKTKGESQTKQSKSKIKVLLVDDHEMMREGLKKIIEEENDLTVIAEAPDGEQAIKLAHETQPDVILMDINLPGMNGIDATEKIKSELPKMCIIGLSLHNDEEVVREMRKVGASAYLNKSNAFETLCATIRSEAKK